MRALLIAAGNSLRRDDGVAHAVLELLDAEARAVFQLRPELAEDIAGYDTVVFIDADAGAEELSIGAVDDLPPSRLFTHVSTPAEIVALARSLFDFSGRAFLCRIPVDDLSAGEGLSPRATALAARAAEKLETLLVSSGECV